jgi:hypothetical protein
METAHFKSPEVESMPSATLVLNQESANIEALDIEWDVERPTSVVTSELDSGAKVDLNNAPIMSTRPTLGPLSLAAITGDTRSVHFAAPVDDAGDLLGRGAGALSESEFFIRGATATTLSRLGALVRAHTVVSVAGAGSRHSGNYYVMGVRHLIDSSKHRMEIELARNGWNV